MKYLIILLLTIFSGHSYACSCAELSGRDVMESDYDVSVFIAFVTEAKAISSNGKYEKVIAKFDVEKIFKGSEPMPTTVRTYLDSATCGFPIEVGSKYIFVASREGSVNYCTSRLIPEYSYDLEVGKYLKDLETNMGKLEITND